MTTLKIPTPLRPYADGVVEITVTGNTIAEILQDMVHQHPALKVHIFNEDGELRPFVNLFKAEDNIRDLQGLETAITEDDRLMLIPSIAGGK